MPVEITVRLTDTPTATAQVMPAASSTTGPASTEAVSIDPDYTTRGGYDPNFLYPFGTTAHSDRRGQTGDGVARTSVSPLQRGDESSPPDWRCSPPVNIDGSAANDPPRKWAGGSAIRVSAPMDGPTKPCIATTHSTVDIWCAGSIRGRGVRERKPPTTTPSISPIAHRSIMISTPASTLWVGLEDQLVAQCPKQCEIKVNVLTRRVFSPTTTRRPVGSNCPNNSGKWQQWSRSTAHCRPPATS